MFLSLDVIPEIRLSIVGVFPNEFVFDGHTSGGPIRCYICYDFVCLAATTNVVMLACRWYHLCPVDHSPVNGPDATIPDH